MSHLNVKPQAVIVWALLDANRDAAKLRDYSGSLPLHFAMDQRASDRILEALLESYPRAAEEQYVDGCGRVAHRRSSLFGTSLIHDHSPPITRPHFPMLNTTLGMKRFDPLHNM